MTGLFQLSQVWSINTFMPIAISISPANSSEYLPIFFPIIWLYLKPKNVSNMVTANIVVIALIISNPRKAKLTPVISASIDVAKDNINSVLNDMFMFDSDFCLFILP